MFGVFYEYGRCRGSKTKMAGCGVLAEISHKEWDVADDFLSACAKVDPTKINKITQYEKFTFVDFTVVKALGHFDDSDNVRYIYRDDKLRNKYKEIYELKDNQDIIMDENAGQVVKIGKKFNNKIVMNIYSKRKTESLKQIFKDVEYVKNGKVKTRKQIIYNGEEDADKYLYIRFADKSIIKISRERIASAKKLAAKRN